MLFFIRFHTVERKNKERKNSSEDSGYIRNLTQQELVAYFRAPEPQTV